MPYLMAFKALPTTPSPKTVEVTPSVEGVVKETPAIVEECFAENVSGETSTHCFSPAFEYNSPSFSEGANSISLTLDWVLVRAMGKKGDPPLIWQGSDV
ncbi:hypothetical protein L1987_42379 [Smallanthus sonchifolius]|uniref:Uncharacterized protein n=1 Tax=Smallanthus sonchifolius TaxID=185202 RepID=A0ACB9GJN4_9ASTR|nr:hypothetical protein L1987_42379 [Smallanthus sonchifolius]